MNKALKIIILYLLILFIVLMASYAKANEVYFTPSDDCQNRIIQLIENAKDSIDISIYSFTDEKIYNALLKKNIKIRIVADSQQASGKYSKILPILSSKKAIGCVRETGVMHNKYMIIDNQYVVTGSYNWSDNARKSNNENCIIVDDLDLVPKYKNNFNKLYNKYCEQ